MPPDPSRNLCARDSRYGWQLGRTITRLLPLALCMQGDFTPSKLSIGWLNCLLYILNFAERSQALADLYTGLFCSIWTVHWVNGFMLNCLLIVFNVSELSQTLVCWAILLYLNCVLDEWIHNELFIGCLEFCCHRLWLICMLSDFALSELLAEWIDFYWTVWWLFWMLLNCHRL